MNITALRAHPEYTVCMNKIKSYHPGFTFRMDWTEIHPAKGNALKVVLRDAIEAGYLEKEKIEYAFGLGLTDMVVSAETYKRTNKED
jgi:hypothetical protein